MLHAWRCVLPSDVSSRWSSEPGGSLTVADLSDLIRHRRAARDLTQLELAMLTGFDVDTIAEFEAGRNLDRYAKFFTLIEEGLAMEVRTRPLSPRGEYSGVLP